ncbi:hypothetical protein [Salegentibacter sediminis]|uniref:hypothetical protein n=1 Tax=Salegentibacter sediminis TaxID=1930251 RepID=UPI0009C0C321|nr:hypothetical protein [Salegentibacter sediminis]
MKYITIYRTKDITEVSGIKEIFVRESIDFKILDTETSPEEADTGLKAAESQIQVEEKEKKRAESILTQHGYSGVDQHFEKPHVSRLPDSRAKPMIGKWTIFILVALVVLIAIILFTWFMIPE